MTGISNNLNIHNHNFSVKECRLADLIRKQVSPLFCLQEVTKVNEKQANLTNI